MTIEWLAGNRIRGTSAERTSTTGFNPVVGVTGGWKELDRTTLGSSANIIDVSSLDNKRYYMVLYDLQRSGSNNMQFNSLVGNTTIDATANYSQRKSIDGGTDTTGISLAEVSNTAVDTNLHNVFSVGNIANLSGKEKLFITNVVDSNVDTASNAPKRSEIVSKWSNTSNPIDVIRADTTAGGRAFGADSEVVVLGWDPADTHSTNFWTELASVELGSAGANIGSGTITAKKYLWIQTLIKPAAACNVKITFNSDTGSNYVDRYSYNGGADSTRTSQANMSLDLSGNNALKFYNLFIVNNSANEKLIIGNSVDPTATGAGTAPDRAEHAAKWVNTSAQITDIDFDSTSGNYAAGSILKVWGSN